MPVSLPPEQWPATHRTAGHPEIRFSSGTSVPLGDLGAFLPHLFGRRGRAGRTDCCWPADTCPVEDPQGPLAAAAAHRRNGALVARTEHRHNQVRTLRQEGKTIRAIMRDLGLSRGTVRRFVRADHVDDLVAKPRTRPAPGYRVRQGR
jgi:hypothetical protein